MIIEKLKWWNKRTYNEAMKLFNSGERRVAINQATGTGKSFVIMSIAETLDKIDNKHKKLIIVPLNGIKDQFIEDYNLPEHIEIISYHMIAKMNKSKTIDLLKDKFSLIVADELHRTGAKTWRPALEKLIELNPNAKILGATATPIRIEGKKKINMIDEMFDGNSVGNISLTYAIKNKILPVYSHYISIYSLKKEMEMKKEQIDKMNDLSYESKQSLKEFIDDKIFKWQETSGIDDSIKEAFSIFKEKNQETINIVVFCMNKKHINEIMPNIVSGFNKTFNGKEVKTYIYHSETSNNDYNDFKNQKYKNCVNLLFVVDKLNEGVHLKHLHGGIMVRPTESPIVYFQQLGRLLSFSNINEKPIILDLVNNSSSIKNVEKRIREYSENKESNQIIKNINNSNAVEKDEVDLIINSRAIEALKDLEEIEQLTREESKLFWEYDGKQRSVKELASIFRESETLIRMKLNEGLNPYQIKEILDLSKDESHLVNGKHYSFEEFSQTFKIPVAAIVAMFSTEQSLQKIYNRINNIK